MQIVSQSAHISHTSFPVPLLLTAPRVAALIPARAASTLTLPDERHDLIPHPKSLSHKGRGTFNGVLDACAQYSSGPTVPHHIAAYRPASWKTIEQLDAELQPLTERVIRNFQTLEAFFTRRGMQS